MQGIVSWKAKDLFDVRGTRAADTHPRPRALHILGKSTMSPLWRDRFFVFVKLGLSSCGFWDRGFIEEDPSPVQQITIASHD